MDDLSNQQNSDPPDIVPQRRQFLRKVVAIFVGTITFLIPSGAGIAVLLDPLRRKSKAAGFIRITTLDAVPTDGSPRRFQVVADRIDAWSKLPGNAVGSVYLQRKGETVIAFNTCCPHAGCPVDVVPGEGFHCPCHNSTFKPDGSVVIPSPSSRGLDQLEVDEKALQSGVVQVRYQNFQAGVPGKIVRS